MKFIGCDEKFSRQNKHNPKEINDNYPSIGVKGCSGQAFDLYLLVL